ncbi:MAG: hypothetical protein HY800_02460 [Ignavibacteriales bacterium]|nr:hypothetical protein [Ignavibacteriales bacterium]
MRTIFMIAIGILTILNGCDDNCLQSNVTPPSSPRGLYTFAGDRYNEIYWDENPESDIAGYNVFVCNSYSGKYQYLRSTTQTYYVDNSVQNGFTYYYRVSAYDRDENESQLSRQIVYATPRPDGYNVTLQDYRTSPNLAGYDFSTNSIGPYNDQYTDIFFEYYDHIYYMDVWDDTEIQDMGYTSSLDEIIKSPTVGWSPTKDVRLITGHTYVIRTWDYHYAKIRIIAFSSSYVAFDWAYQLQADNTWLKINGGDRKVLNLGSGAKSRNL